MTYYRGNLTASTKKGENVKVDLCSVFEALFIF